jgi:serine/threonine protein kinase
MHDFESKYREGGGIIEKSGTRLDKEEVALLGDLLEKMLRLRPEDRITMEEVVRHPWFTYRSRVPLAGCTDPENTTGAASINKT